MNPQTPVKIVMVVVITIAVLALVGVTSLCVSLFFKTWADPAILTALISITSGLVGSLCSILVNTRQSTPGSSSVIVDNPPSDPVPTAPQTPIKPEPKKDK